MIISIANIIGSISNLFLGFKPSFALNFANIANDFTFTRSSFATRVNEFGLIETVTDLGSDLVRNGDFEEIGSELVQNGDFEELGSELVTNGTFDTDSNWNLPIGYTIEDGVLKINSTGYKIAAQPKTLTVGKTYKVAFDVLNYVKGNVQVGLAGSDANNTTPIATSNGSYEFYVTRLSGGTNNISVITGNDSELEVDNVSVKQVDPNNDWSLIGTANISEGVANFPDTTVSYLIQGPVIPLTVKTYKLQYEVVSTNGGSFRLSGGNSAFGTITLDSATVGVKTYYLTSNGTKRNLQFYNNTSFIGSIDNVSLKQVDPNDEWQLLNGATIEGGKLVTDNTGTFDAVRQANILEVGKKYLIEADVVLTQGFAEFKFSGNGTHPLINAPFNGRVSNVVTATGTLAQFGFGTDAIGSIDNVSVQEVLEDDLPRIDYSGATFDVPVLGDELVTDGSFDNPSNWNLNTPNGEISGGQYNQLAQGFCDVKNNPNVVPVIGKTYQISIETFGTYGVFYVRFGGVQTAVSPSSGLTTFTVKAISTQALLIAQSTITTLPAGYDNVSVKEVTAYTTTDKGAFLLEPQSTNLIPYSEDFSQVDWIKHTDIVLTPNQPSPDGMDNAYKVEGTIGSSYVLDGGFSAVTTQSRSIYMRADTNGVVYSLGDAQSNQINVTTEWQRYELQEVSNAFYAVDFRGSGVTLDTVYIWGSQVEALPYATSYIPTNGAIVTRSAETCVKSNLSTDGIFGGKVGTLFLHTTDMEVVGTSLNALTPFRFYRQLGDAYRFYYDGDASFIGSNIDLSNNGGELKMAFSISETGVEIYVNGSLHVSYTYLNPMLSDLENWVWNAETKYKERVKDFKIYDKALTDDELATLTTI